MLQLDPPAAAHRCVDRDEHRLDISRWREPVHRQVGRPGPRGGGGGRRAGKLLCEHVLELGECAVENQRRCLGRWYSLGRWHGLGRWLRLRSWLRGRLRLGLGFFDNRHVAVEDLQPRLKLLQPLVQPAAATATAMSVSTTYRQHSASRCR